MNDTSRFLQNMLRRHGSSLDVDAFAQHEDEEPMIVLDGKPIDYANFQEFLASLHGKDDPDVQVAVG
ncbi:hypothetical protein LCGC14_1185670 [marine sediment metagenome]|uniref:Uncharacterized protein n=1 Tax=marine sediment metagenome TaxID=412755 RepID=A0A0F9LKT4_9ZZZZ